MTAETFTLLGIIINTAGLIIIALLNYISNRNVKEKVEEVRHATNSMKDELVKAALIKGEQTGKEKQIALQQEIKEGIKEKTKEE